MAKGLSSYVLAIVMVCNATIGYMIPLLNSNKWRIKYCCVMFSVRLNLSILKVNFLRHGIEKVR